MKSVIGPRGNRLSKGFTLLEICFVLCIMAIIVGATLPNVYGWIKEERLRAPARQLSFLARTARLAAIEHQQVYEVVIRPDKLWMAAVDPAVSPNKDATEAPTNLSPQAGPEELPEPYTVPDSTAVLIQRWTESKMSKALETHWNFQPSGLCEPISVKFVQDAAELELDFDPLTATVANEKYVIP